MNKSKKNLQTRSRKEPRSTCRHRDLIKAMEVMYDGLYGAAWVLNNTNADYPLQHSLAFRKVQAGMAAYRLVTEKPKIAKAAK